MKAAWSGTQNLRLLMQMRFQHKGVQLSNPNLDNVFGINRNTICQWMLLKESEHYI